MRSLWKDSLYFVSFIWIIFFSILATIFFHCFSMDTVDVENLFCFLPRRGTGNTSHSSANESKPIGFVVRLLSKAWIMTPNIDNTNDSGSNPSWENHWEPPSAYISVPDPLNNIASIFMGSFQMLLSLDLKLPSSLRFFYLDLKLKQKGKKNQLFKKSKQQISDECMFSTCG